MRRRSATLSFDRIATDETYVREALEQFSALMSDFPVRGAPADERHPTPQVASRRPRDFQDHQLGIPIIADISRRTSSRFARSLRRERSDQTLTTRACLRMLRAPTIHQSLRTNSLCSVTLSPTSVWSGFAMLTSTSSRSPSWWQMPSGAMVDDG